MAVLPIRCVSCILSILPLLFSMMNAMRVPVVLECVRIVQVVDCAPGIELAMA